MTVSIYIVQMCSGRIGINSLSTCMLMQSAYL